jgi:subtilisin family serine protease
VARSLGVLVVVMAVLVGAVPASAAPGDGTIDGRYIVVFKDSVSSVNRETDAQERRGGFTSRYRYGHALKGFAAALTPQQVRQLQADPSVAQVVPDREVRALGSVPLAPNEPTPPTGVRRIEAASTTTARQASTANVAVIDTGVDLTHPDLNAVSGKNCVSTAAGATAQDDHGHGTHVAGTIAAENDGAGVVGVAPGTRIYAVKVLNSAGSGTQSQVICGIDWVTANAAALNIKVANMSLGGTGSALANCPNSGDPEHEAVCRSTAAGVTYAVAAGNSARAFDNASSPDVPAAYPEALTVTAVSDSDGKPGATGGAPACRTSEADDKYASFSNWATTVAAQNHTIAGPGVCIRSTWLSGGYNTISGTSMATPHLAGAVALCIGDGATPGPCAGMTPAQVIQKMRSDAQARTTAAPGYGFAGDPTRPVSGRYYGYLDYSGDGTAPPPPPPPTRVTASPTGATILTGTLRSGAFADLASADATYYRVNSNTSRTRTTSWYASFAGVPASPANLAVTYQGQNSRTCSQTVYVFRWSDSAWVSLGATNVGTTEVRRAGLVPPGAPSAYVSSGALRVRVGCTTTAGTFFASGNQVQIAYDS